MSHQFGGEWTDLKLEVMSAYFGAYARALRNQTFVRWYVDAFAGTGERVSGRAMQGDTSEVLFGEFEESVTRAKQGSVRVALEIEPPFQRYLFIERSRDHVARLNSLRKEYKGRLIDVVTGDANSELSALCASTDWRRTRAAVFVDPYGMQVSWSTLSQLAQTEAVDIALLFPTGALNRLLIRDGSIPEAWMKRIDDHLGHCNWRSALYRSSERSDLFDAAAPTEKKVDIAGLQSFVAGRLRALFPYVHEDAVSLMNSKGSVLYDLFIICANPSKRAIALSRKLATGAIRAAKRPKR